MEATSKVETLRQIIQQVANERPIFFEVKGEGIGNLDTNSFILEVRQRARLTFGKDYSEQRICGVTASAVDYYFEDEATIVEIALGLKSPNSEFEKDIFKALVAKESVPVQRLALIGKPGACKKCMQPGRNAIRELVLRHHNLQIDVYDIENIHSATVILRSE